MLGSAANARRIADKLADARSTNAVVVGRVAIDPFEPEDGAGSPRAGRSSETSGRWWGSSARTRWSG